jgi:Lrp/AsnC family transcriptional regulator for asnA, asnC and gidA
MSASIESGRLSGATDGPFDRADPDLCWPGIDPVDFGIIAALQEDGRASLLGISRRLGVPVGGVRQRYDRLVGTGYIRSVALVDPAVVGRPVVALLEAEVRRDLDEVERRLAAIPHVAWLATGLDYRTAYVQVSTRSNAELAAVVNETIRPIEQIGGVTTHLHLRNWSPVFRFSGSPEIADVEAERIMWRRGEPTTRPLDEVDHQLLACLAEDARMTVTAMTERTGLSVPATRQRLMRLLKDEVVRIRTRPNPLSDLIRTVRVVVEIERDSTAVAEELARLPNITYVTESTGRASIHLEMTCATEAQVADGYRRIGQVPGVRDARLVRYRHVLRHTGRW